ncbi:DUF2934 domain-containing protein [Rhizobium laguerreae]
MAETREEWIKKRAYTLWEEEGYPTGRESIHWEQARHERDALEGSASNGKEAKPKTKRTATGGKTNGVVTPAPKRTASRKTAS